MGDLGFKQASSKESLWNQEGSLSWAEIAWGDYLLEAGGAKNRKEPWSW